MITFHNRIIRGREYSLYLNGDVYKDGKYKYSIYSKAILEFLLDNPYKTIKQKTFLDTLLSSGEDYIAEIMHKGKDSLRQI